MQFKHFLWLIPLAGFAFWQASQIASWPMAWQTLLHYAPIALAGLGIVLSYYLNRIQPLMVFLTILMVTAGFDWLYPGYAVGMAPELFYPLVSLWMPLALLLWAVMPERGVYSLPYNLLMLLLFVLPLAGLNWAMTELSFYWASLISEPVSATPGYWLHLPKISVLVLLGVFVILMLRLTLLKQPKVFDAVMVVVYVLMAYGLNELSEPLLFDWMLAVSAFLVLLSLVFDAHFIAYNDQLTGLSGRRALLESFSGLGRKYAIAMADIDHFKKFNDTYGHDIGDLALQQVAQGLAKVQGGGKVYRYGGEEFTIVFPRKTAMEAQPLLQGLCQSIASQPLVFKQDGEEKSVPITVSIGVADRSHGKTPEEVMKCADEALYAAKQAGRNQVKIYGETAPKASKSQTKSKSTKRKSK